MEENELILTANPCCDTIATCDISNPGTQVQCKCCDDCDDKVNEEHLNFIKLAAVLQDSVLHAWKLHLKARKHSIHVILEEYYDDAFDMIDDLIEHYQGIYKFVIIDDSIISDVAKHNDPYIYFTNVRDYLVNFINDTNNFNERNCEIKSDIDDILRLIDSTLYKLGNLTESKIKSFEAFIYDSKI